ncbi:hypothetical protein Ahy_A04g017570 [Arachis hypogaea]|uniref:Uncharacterized protein n=1 Tax=Arachis hypogaea TaxID=3818 RepID=A0A445DBG6_ARAHY|nr:hypothetical protein Ahy_A04g017570 [Arachis hypogaea]
MMNIMRRKRGYLMLNEEYNFNDDKFEGVDILDNLLRNFLERLNLETSNSTVNSIPQCRPRTAQGILSLSKKQKKSVNQESSELPQNFKNLISDMVGSRITVVIERTLHDSDLNPQQNGLLILSQQVVNSGFVPPTKLESLEEKKKIIVKLVEKHRAKLYYQWFQYRLRSSSSNKNKLKEPLMDFDDSTVPFSSKKKAANAFSYCLESEVQVVE